MNKTIFILSYILVLFAVSCSDESVNMQLPHSDDVAPLVLYASIDGSATTRAVVTEKEDKWSYTGFEDEDEMGFYSPSGNFQGDNDGTAPFTNERLIYTEKKFIGPDGATFSPTHMTGSQIFMYFPYEENIGSEGKKLRIEQSDETFRCVDFLSSNSINIEGVKDGHEVALYGTFSHAFSELIIVRGEGFESPPTGKERITAVLRVPYTHLQVEVGNTEDTWSCTPKLVDKTPSGSEDGARRWDAWKGGNYGITDEDPIGKEAWYVIVPTLAGNRSLVEYIELYDNEGNLLRVNSLRLSGGNTKYVDAGFRYPMEITMKELVPTVNPFPITPWEDDIDLTDERTRGISNYVDFRNWVEAYNAYVLDDMNDEKIRALLKYGDTFVDADGKNRSWHFYVLADIDLADFSDNNGEGTTGSADTIIPELRENDILDGISTTLVNSKFINHTISGLKKTFIRELKGTIQNFDFIKPEVINKETTSTNATGIIANSMQNASVINCNIEEGTMFHPNGPAGMVAGTMYGGQVTDCTISGMLTAKSTASGDAKNIIGAPPTGNPTFRDNNTAGVVP